jgi:exopolyphosphatase / guanosine-5'-triphosphate,3'-diphosphate pyrophosphatase
METGMTERRMAAIDIGTNSFHLIIVDAKDNGSFTTRGRERDVVRLGEGMTDMKHLSETAMARAISVLGRFRLVADSHGAPIRAVATSAVREALNRDVFVARVRQEVGIDIEIVSGFEEARLIYLGVLQALPVFDRRILLVDIGGGSTEFLVGERGDVRYANSLKLGAVRFWRRFFQDRHLKPKAVKACREHLRGELVPIRRALEYQRVDTVVGSSGTIHAVASMAEAMAGREYPSVEGNVTLTREQLDAVLELLLDARTTGERASLPGLDPARADIIVPGALILEQIFEQCDIRQLVTSKYALREGIVLDSIQKQQEVEHPSSHLHDIRRTSVYHLAENCRFEPRHAENVARYALLLFDQLSELHRLAHDERELLEAAAILHDIGYHISHAQHHRHSWYIVRNAELLGFTEREKDIIANVARYHRKSHPKLKHENLAQLSDRDRVVVQRLAAILRIADGLDRRHLGLFQSIACAVKWNTVTLELRVALDADCSLELWGAERRKQLFEELFGVTLRFSPRHIESGELPTD